MTMPQVLGSLVSVVIPTFNHGDFLCEAIESVLGQTYPYFEIIVVDDGSSDHTQKKIECYGSRIRYFYQENKGLSAARNRGIKEAKGNFIALLDADDLWLPKKLELQMQCIAIGSGGTVGIVGCGGYWMNDQGCITGEFMRRNYPHRLRLWKELLMKNVLAAGGSAALIRVECFRRVGLFDEKLHAAEDWDMWLRIASYFEVQFIEKPLVKIRVRKDSMSAPLHVQNMLNNELKVLKKNFSNTHSRLNIFFKQKALSQRNYAAAVAYREMGNRREVARHILRSIYFFPFNVFTKCHIALILYLLLGHDVLKKGQS